MARQAAREAARDAVRKVTITDYPASDFPNRTELARQAAESGAQVVSTGPADQADSLIGEKELVELRPQALLVSWVIIMLVLKKLLKK